MKEKKRTVLNIGLPKGSLQESTLHLFRKAGFNINVGSRSYVPTIDDPELSGLLIRAQEMARYVQDGILDMGLTGRDWVLEQNAKVKEVCPLLYARGGLRPVRWVVAVPNDSPIQRIRDLQGKRVATELVQFTRRYLKKKGVEAQVEFSWGATEVKAPRLADAIVELTETGSSLRANNLRIVETILESTTVLIAVSQSLGTSSPSRRTQGCTSRSRCCPCHPYRPFGPSRPRLTRSEARPRTPTITPSLTAMSSPHPLLHSRHADPTHASTSSARTPGRRYWSTRAGQAESRP